MDARAGTSEQSGRRKATRHNNYSTLNVLVAGTVVNVYGVVKFYKQAIKTRGNDFCMVISIVDQSLHEDWKKLKCILFEKEETKLPSVKVGQIIRFHRLKINQFCGELQGQSGPGFSWLVFDPTEVDDVKPLSASSISHTFTDFDKEKVIELSRWISCKHLDIDDIKKCITLSNISPDLYFNLICQVIAVYVIEEGVCFLVRAWDGTKATYHVREVNIENATHGDVDEQLMKQANGMVYDICLYEDHFLSAYTKIKPGCFLQLTNLHAVKFTGQKDRRGFSAFPSLELSLHRGVSYNRGFTVLSEDCEEVESLKKCLDVTVTRSTLQNTDVSSSSFTQSLNVNNNEDEIIVSSNESTDQSSIVFSCDMHSQDSATPIMSQNSTSNRCMLQTSSVILYHHHISPTKIKDILNHSVPYKFRLHAKIVDYEPKPCTPENFLKMYCPLCEATSNIGRKSCENCNNMINSPCDDNHSSDKIEFIYMLRFLLQDNTGWIIVNIWRDDAVRFFRNLHPKEILCNPEKLAEVKEDLERICPGTEYCDKPWIECCIKSYTGLTGTCFQIFDTCLV